MYEQTNAKTLLNTQMNSNINKWQQIAAAAGGLLVLFDQRKKATNVVYVIAFNKN